MSVTPSQFDLLSRLMDASAMRHQTIANNVANVNTPGYQAQDVAFEDALQRELERGHETTKPAAPKMVAAIGGAVRSDGNNVDIDGEMGKLGKNTLLYQVYSQLLATKMAQMRLAINGR